MSLINKVAAIIDSKVKLEELKYSKDFIYESDRGILNIPWKKILDNPPKNNSITTSKEIDLISEATKNRSNKAVELIYKVDKDPLILFLEFFEGKNIDVSTSNFDNYWNIAESYVYALKYHFNRPRPEQIAPYLNKEIRVIYTDTHGSPSYPSGHTLYAYLAAHVFSEKYPEYTKNFFELAKQAGIARILQGVHYPSDNKAGLIAAQYLFAKIKEKLDEQEGKNFPVDK
jgi:hypothetical protein